jgi:hypothetical protein
MRTLRTIVIDPLRREIRKAEIDDDLGVVQFRIAKTK